MNCASCAAVNLNDALYCNRCGEPLTVSALARYQARQLQEKNIREVELTEVVAKRLLDWVKLLGSACTVLVIIFGFLLGKSYFDVQKDIADAQGQIRDSVTKGTGQIHTSIEEAKSEISIAMREIPPIEGSITQLNSDLARYKEVNQRIEKLQADFSRLQTDVIDLGHKSLRAETVETTSPGGGMTTFGRTGCDQPKARGYPFSICAQGSPLALTSVMADGRTRPVASYSEIGFQDVSKAPRPGCTNDLRGTLYVEKGLAGKADMPFLCIKSASENYTWIQLAVAN
ncbi:hypothetical protein [Tunturiibacter lichenicola]|uniref:hypothetical protein n=1 Tax=Tunturiibacter lichenicola TaxID=2051959 RepID=UPI003D9BFD87